MTVLPQPAPVPLPVLPEWNERIRAYEAGRAK